VFIASASLAPRRRRLVAGKDAEHLAAGCRLRVDREGDETGLEARLPPVLESPLETYHSKADSTGIAAFVVFSTASKTYARDDFAEYDFVALWRQLVIERRT
jgi:hypothetical protein